MSGLEGLTIVEVADTLGAAFAGSLLADYGATVIVCEPPEGSKLRRLGPAKLNETRWKILARNKQSIAADWADSADLIRRLLGQAEMLIVDIAAPQRAGNPWFAVLETLSEADRPLVVEVFPTGADRPELWPYASLAEFAGAASGVMALTGHTGKTPIQAEAPLTDYLAGALAATRALIELRKARLTGAPPATVSTPLHQAIQRMIEWQTPVATAKGRAETRMANNFPMNAGIANMHPTCDGKYVAISAVTQATAMRLMNMVGGPELCADPRYATAEARSTGLDELYARIDAWTGARTTREILETAAAHDVVLGPIYTVDDILADEQVMSRGNVLEVDGVQMPSVTPRLSGLEGAIRNLGPGVGADKARVAEGAAQRRHSPPPNLPPQGGGIRKVDAFPHSEKALPFEGEGGRETNHKLKVLELGAVIAGPFAGSLMAELGGDVVKIETPGAGDSLRGMGPTKDGWPLWFGASAREKSCVTLNLKHAQGKKMFLRLVAQADVLVENFRPGVLERLGLSWDDLKAVNPRLVMLSISGFGQTGPQKTRPGFGKIAEGLSGIVNLTGPGGQSPLFVGFSLADASAGLFGIYGVAAALVRRDVLGGEGGRIDLALYEPLMRMLDCQFALRAETGTAPARSGGNDPYGFGIMSADRPRFRSVGSATGDWYLIAVPDSEAAKRLDEMAGAASLEEWGVRLANADIEAALRGLGVDFTLVFDGLSIARSPYFQARGDVVETEHHGIGRITAAGRVDGLCPEPVYRPPSLGEDNAAVFGRVLGLNDAALKRLAEEGVI